MRKKYYVTVEIFADPEHSFIMDGIYISNHKEDCERFVKNNLQDGMVFYVFSS